LYNCCSPHWHFVLACSQWRRIPSRTGRYAVIGCKLKQTATVIAATAVQQLCKSFGTCFMFYCMFYFTCDRSFAGSLYRRVCLCAHQWFATLTGGAHNNCEDLHHTTTAGVIRVAYCLVFRLFRSISTCLSFSIQIHANKQSTRLQYLKHYVTVLSVL